MPAENSNKRIAKNAVALYLRMIVTMVIGLYTSRVILEVLGVEDFGIYSVVASFVTSFSLVSSSLQSSIMRSLTFELGKGGGERLRQTFSMAMLTMFALSAVVAILLETFGLWYLENKIVLPAERADAAFWCFQFSVLTFIIGLICAPYSSSITSHERMDIYAYFSIFDSIAKLLICFAAAHSPADRLATYAALLATEALLNQSLQLWFCRRHFSECRITWTFDKKIFKDLSSFAGWNFIGCSAAVLRTQGASLLLNWAGGPIVNAANGIANQACNVVNSFVSNFTLAFDPQITKRYASGEHESLMQLLIYGSRFSYYLLFFISLPLLLNTEFLLELWLGQVPEYTVPFIRWTIAFLLAEAVSRPIITAKNATGDIKTYQIVVGGTLLLMLPLSYVGIVLGLPLEVVPFCNALTATFAIGARMVMLKGAFGTWSSKAFTNKVIVNVLCVSAIAAVLPIITYTAIESGWINFSVTTLACIFSTAVTIYWVGCNNQEREMARIKSAEAVRKLKEKIGLER